MQSIESSRAELAAARLRAAAMTGTFERRSGGAALMRLERRDAIDEIVRSDGWSAVFRRIIEGDPVLLGALRREPQRAVALRGMLDRLIAERGRC